jgi:hypothetical protein
MQKKGLLFTGIILLFFIAYFGVLNSFVGVPNTLKYDTECTLNDYDRGQCESTASLNILNESNVTSIAFTVDYHGNIESIRNKGTCRVGVDYKLFNFNTNSYENIHSKSWFIVESSKRDAELKIDGDSIYLEGIPELVEVITTRDSRRSEDRRYAAWFSCTSNLNDDILRDLIDYHRENDSRYSLKCMYPDTYISEHSVDDDSYEKNDLIYFPKLNIASKQHIQNNSMQLKVSFDKKSTCERLDIDDFGIDVWDVTYYVNPLSCKEVSDCSIDCRENEKVTCAENLCECSPQEAGISQKYMFYLIPLVFLFIVILILKRSKGKGVRRK